MSDDESNTPVSALGYEQCRDELVEVVRQLEQGRAEVENQYVRSVTRQGNTALMIAARRSYTEVVRVLLAKKADPNKTDFTGRTALTYAKQSGSTTIEAMLRKVGGHE